MATLVEADESTVKVVFAKKLIIKNLPLQKDANDVHHKMVIWSRQRNDEALSEQPSFL